MCIEEYRKNLLSAPPSHLYKDIFGYVFGGFGSTLLIDSILIFISWKPLGQPPQQSNFALIIVLFVVFSSKLGSTHGKIGLFLV